MCSGRLSHFILCSSTCSFYGFSHQPRAWALFNDPGGLDRAGGGGPWAHLNPGLGPCVTRTHPGFTRGSFSFVLHISDLNRNQRRVRAAGPPPTLWMCRALRPNEGKNPAPFVLTLQKRLPTPISRRRRNPLGCVNPLWLPMPPTQLSLPL